MTLEYSDLVHDQSEEQALIDNCPYIDQNVGEDEEPSLKHCDSFYLDQYIMSERQWFMPGVNILQIGGFNTIITLRLRTDNLHTWEDVKKHVAVLTEEMRLKDYLVFKTCPGCGIDLPVVDYRIREDGLCTFCGSKEREETK